MYKYLLIFLFISVNVFAQDSGKLEYSAYSDNIPVSKTGIVTADSIYHFIENELPFIDFNDCNNCNSRAHIIAAVIEKKFPGVKSAKAWLFADFKRASREDVYKYKPYIFLTHEADCNKWGYHVAPLVIIEHEKGTDTFVIDHSTRNSPVKLKDWAEKLVHNGSKGLIVVKDKMYYKFPDNDNNKFIDTSITWTDKESLYDYDYSKSLGKILIARYGFWDPWTYRKHYDEIKQMLE